MVVRERKILLVKELFHGHIEVCMHVMLRIWIIYSAYMCIFSLVAKEIIYQIKIVWQIQGLDWNIMINFVKKIYKEKCSISLNKLVESKCRKMIFHAREHMKLHQILHILLFVWFNYEIAIDLALFLFATRIIWWVDNCFEVVVAGFSFQW